MSNFAAAQYETLSLLKKLLYVWIYNFYLSAKNPEKYSIQIQLDGYDNLKILIYSLESAIAENFHAILQRFELAGGMTDFYDIYYLSGSFDYNRYKVSDSNLGNTVAKK